MRSTVESLRRLTFVVVLAAAIPARAPAQQAGAAQPIPIRQVLTLAATDSGSLAFPSSMRPLSDGRLLVSDLGRRQLHLFDATMRSSRILADTAPGARNPFGTRPLGAVEIARYRGDSSLFIEPGSSSVAGTMIVVDPDGNFGRAIALRSMQQGAYLATSVRGGAWVVDPRGGLIYSGRVSPPPVPRPPPSSRTDTLYLFSPDTAAVMRIDLDAFGKEDTIAKYGVAASRRRQIRSGGRTTTTIIVNPLLDSDEWTVLPDGTVAIIRSHDYHIDWYLPDGSKKSTPKMPFDWRRLSTEEKQQMIDSARAILDAQERARATAVASGAASPGVTPRPPTEFVKPDEMRDYYPPVRPGQVFADWNGNVWALPSTSVAAPGGLLYDVINRDGTIVERVQLPVGRRIVAFGKGDIVYMMAGTPTARLDAVPTARIERARIVR